ncbi:ABC transporter ATP-binding protein/permease [Solimonas terrae]|uniref:ABC transporter ATP-binding protein/permease n=1 Tax=Solimonas terrae TaxID=1396819 RepID=A0A6M2BRQ5_9GAMM|nr:ABC transporter ATP-binding protein/permease [Solimonas terrae]NGY04667.1 ABC transporter ATP-binding protein/permease [Solimonas terrae]
MSLQSEARATAAAFAVRPGFVRQLRLMVAAWRASGSGKALIRRMLTVVVVIAATVYGQIRLNQWNKPFFDALSRRDINDFLVQLGVFAVIIGTLLVLNVTQRWTVENLKIELRRGLVRDLVGHWMMPRRAYWLSHSGPMGVNPDQRMHEDALKFCDLTADLGVGLFQATILFGSFAGILWSLSSDFSVRFAGADYVVPGYMLWAALLYAGLGSLLSYGVGRNLIHRNAERYASEAVLRFSLVRVNEHLDAISLAEGEDDERLRIERYLADVLAAVRRLALGLTNLEWVKAGFGWITTVAPILAAAPLYFSGKVSFGGLMMAAAAFTQVESALRWFVDNFSIIADWRAALLRVASFRQAVIAHDERPAFDSHIEYADGDAGMLVIDGLEIGSPAGHDGLEPGRLVVKAGDHLQIEAAQGTSKTRLFRALTGLWPWGKGRITLPGGERIVYVPRGTPYLPRGSLREILAYPGALEGHGDAAFTHALERVGLGRLVALLDATERWEHELSQDEQLSIVFARILLQAPPWVLIDDAFTALDADMQERVADIFGNALPQTAVIHIGRAGPVLDALFTHVARLVKVSGMATVDDDAPAPGSTPASPSDSP